MCKYCENKHNFADVGVKDMHGKYHVYLACGSSDVPESDRFDCCPKCGTPLGEVKPLTVEQLREMDGKPVFVVDSENNERLWCVVSICRHEFQADIPGCDHFWYEECTYGERWTAFDREPKGEAE